MKMLNDLSKLNVSEIVPPYELAASQVEEEILRNLRWNCPLDSCRMVLSYHLRNTRDILKSLRFRVWLTLFQGV